MANNIQEIKETTTEIQDIRAKRLAINASAVTRDVSSLGAPIGNIYAALVVISKRAKQINASLKIELNSKLNEFATTNDNLDEVFENREQIEISKYYEKMANPVILATEEYLNEEIFYHLPIVEEDIVVAAPAAEKPAEKPAVEAVSEPSDDKNDKK